MAHGVEVAGSIPKSFDGGIDFDAMLQADQTIMIERPARENKMNSTTQTKAVKPQLTKLVSKDGRKRNEDSSRSVKSQPLKLAVTIVEDVVPEVINVPSSDEDLSNAPDDIDEETEIEQQSMENMKAKAVTSTEESARKRTSVRDKERPEPSCKRSRVLPIASRVAGRFQIKPATKRLSWFPKKPKIGYTLENNKSTRAAMTMFKKILELTKRPREWDRADILKDDDYDCSN